MEGVIEAKLKTKNFIDLSLQGCVSSAALLSISGVLVKKSIWLDSFKVG